MLLIIGGLLVLLGGLMSYRADREYIKTLEKHNDELRQILKSCIK